MRIRLTLDDVSEQWDLNMPNDHPLVSEAEERTRRSHAVEFDRANIFRLALRSILADSLHVEVLEQESGHESDI